MKRFLLGAAVLFVSFTSASAQFTFTSIDYPGGTLTTARGINNHGEIAGAYRIVPPRHALLIKGGQYLPIDPSSVLGTNYSEAFKSNDRGDVVGQYDDNGYGHGFLLRKGVLTTLYFPGASDTYATGINESGTVVGFWDILDSSGNVLITHGFLWNKGNFTQVDFPGAGDTAALGINDRGDIVGEWDTGITSTTSHGFVLSRGQFTSFDVPFAGATATGGNDVNALGAIVGSWLDSTGVIHGFLAVRGTFTSIDYPGATQTSAWGINSAGQMVGYRIDSAGALRGFFAQPSKRGKP